MNGSVLPASRDDEFNIGYGDNNAAAGIGESLPTMKPNLRL